MDVLRQTDGLIGENWVSKRNSDGDLAGAEFRGSLLIRQSRCYEGHHFPFAGREQGVVFLQLGQLRSLAPAFAIRGERRVDRRRQFLVTERLGEELNRPRLHGADRRWNISVTRNENDRRPCAIGQFALQFQAARPRELQIQHQAGGRVRLAGPQKLRRRTKRATRSPTEAIRLDRASRMR